MTDKIYIEMLYKKIIKLREKINLFYSKQIVKDRIDKELKDIKKDINEDIKHIANLTLNK